MITYKIEGLEAIETIKPLWKKLSDHHKNVSSYFTDDFDGDHYSKRKISIHEKEQVQIMVSMTMGVRKNFVEVSITDHKATVTTLKIPKELEQHFSKHIVDTVPTIKELVFEEKKPLNTSK